MSTWVLVAIVVTTGSWEPKELARFPHLSDCYRAMSRAHETRLYEPLRDGHGRLLRCEWRRSR